MLERLFVVQVLELLCKMSAPLVLILVRHTGAAFT